MKRYMALFTGSLDAPATPPDPATIARGMAGWKQWMADHAAAVVDTGGPVGKTKKMTPNGVVDIRNNVGGYIIVQADSHEAAAAMFEGHPHFTIFPGDGVEVMECMPIPEMPSAPNG